MSVLCNHHRPGRHCRSSLMLLCSQPPLPTPVPWQPRVSFLLLPCTFVWRRDLTSLTQHGYLRFIFTVRFYSPLLLPSILVGFPGGSAAKNPPAVQQSRRHGFDPWVGKILQRRAWEPTPAFLPGEAHGQRSRQAIVCRVAKSRT